MTPHYRPLASFGLALGLAATLPLRAEVKLHSLFSDHMVIQQGIPVKVWGWADAGESVTVTLDGATAKAKPGKDGAWMVKLPKRPAGGPVTLTVQGNNTLTLTNVMIGEVWIASGQSNMEWPLRSAFQGELDINASANPMLRLFTVPKTKADRPMDNVVGAWQVCGPASVSNFTAVGYYFGRDLQKSLKVAVGIIHTSWGGSPAEVWMSEKALAARADYQRDILDAYPAAHQEYLAKVANGEKRRTAAPKTGKAATAARPRAPWKPTELYNGMIAPLIPFGIQGAIWYQGEANAGRACQYRTLFPDLIKNWRKDWGLGNFTFLLVQLAPYMAIRDEPTNSTWAELREAQLLSTKVLPKVGQAVITDVGEEKDIHPKKKEPVGARLALAARGIAYREPIVYSGPVYRSLKVDGGQAILSFDFVGRGLEARDGELKGFAIAGSDQKFVWANAKISGDKIIVSSPQVKQPVAVRYGWADCPVVNLWNQDGLPATPFRTDDFPMITAPKKDAQK
jgi:sialate O-acetylesterase